MANACPTLLICLLVLVQYSIGSQNVSVNNNGGHHIEDSEFPKDLFTPQQLRHGAILLHCLLAVYCFLTIAKVCTEYFMPTITRICQVLKLSDDVAAATFMSIATSSPELFTNIIGTFITASDIGVGHVLGNAYYDMLFVASLGGLAASKEIPLDWWPITRDCAFYLIVAITLTWVVWDGQVDISETLVLLFLYILYFVVMFSNRAIIRFLRSKFNLDIMDVVHEMNAERTMELTAEGLIVEEYTVVPNEEIKNSRVKGPSIQPMNRQQLKERTGVLKKIFKLATLPLTILTALTIPDVRKKGWHNLYPLSFIMCVTWIGLSTYLGTWMISVIGRTIGVPDILMGMVFMAAGGSVVEAYGVYYKARRGGCSIGLSNSMGCNTLDATMCLALPWLIKLLINSHRSEASSSIQLSSQVLHYNCLLLVGSVILIYTILRLNRFTFNWKLGVTAGISYIIVLTIAITMEYVYGTPES